jgi:AcrR family transcriptional regulator
MIIERTAGVFDALGFAAATLNQLVAATGLTRGAFYFHFDSKDALAEAIVQTQQQRWQPLVEELTRDEPDPLRRLIRITYLSGTLFQSDVVMRAGSRLMTERSLIRRELWKSYPWWLRSVQQLLSEAGDELNVDPALATDTWPPREDIPEGVPPGIAALTENLVASWIGLQQQATATGRNDFAERLRVSWLATLPWLCKDQARCDELTELVEELTGTMRSAGPGTGTGTGTASGTTTSG